MSIYNATVVTIYIVYSVTRINENEVNIKYLLWSQTDLFTLLINASAQFINFYKHQI